MDKLEYGKQGHTCIKLKPKLFINKANGQISLAISKKEAKKLNGGIGDVEVSLWSKSKE